jgi:hypothetical protein
MKQNSARAAKIFYPSERLLAYVKYIELYKKRYRGLNRGFYTMNSWDLISWNLKLKIGVEARCSRLKTGSIVIYFEERIEKTGANLDRHRTPRRNHRHCD